MDIDILRQRQQYACGALHIINWIPLDGIEELVVIHGSVVAVSPGIDHESSAEALYT